MDSFALKSILLLLVVMALHLKLARAYVDYETPRNTPYTVTNAVFYHLTGNYTLLGPKQDTGTFQILEINLNQHVWMILYSKPNADKVKGNPCHDEIKDIPQKQIQKIYNNHTRKTHDDEPDTWTIANNTIMCFQILQRASTQKWGTFKYKFEDVCRKDVIQETRQMSAYVKSITIRKHQSCFSLKQGFYTVIDFQMTLKNATSLDRVAITNETTYEVQECRYVRKRSSGYYARYETVKECSKVKRVRTNFILMVTGQTPEKRLLPKWPLVLVNMTRFCMEFDAVEAMEFKDDMVFRVSEFPQCTGVVSNRSGIIVSPGYPLIPYRNNTDCTWTINVRPGEVVSGRFGETESDCSNDFIKLSGVKGGSVNVELLCGITVTGKTFTSRTNQLSIHFKTSTFKNLKGFLIEYKAIGCSLQGLKLPSDSMMINEPKGHIPPGFGLRIACKAGFVFPSKIAEVKLECLADNTWFGHVPFCIGYTVCNITLTSPTGYVSSPGYPNTYPKNANCEWKITVKKDQRIVIKLEDVKSDCMNDYIVLDGVERTVSASTTATTTTSTETTSTSTATKATTSATTTTTAAATTSATPSAPTTTKGGAKARAKRSGKEGPSKECICGEGASVGVAFTSVTNSMTVSFRSNVFQENGYFNMSYRALGCSSDDLRKPKNVLLRNPVTYYPEGYKLLVRCVSGFSFPGGINSLTMTCGKKGPWIGRIPYCIRWHTGL